MTRPRGRTRSEGLDAHDPRGSALIDRAVAVTKSDLTEFVVTNLRIAARRGACWTTVASSS
jgi:hypothetical protein